MSTIKTIDCKMVAKIFKYTFLIGLSLIVFIFVGSFAAGFYFGRDVDVLKFADSLAKRDSQGIWTVKASSKNEIWKTFGYIQAQDRYFQIELTRHASLGRLSEMFGKETVYKDRLARVLAAVALHEFQKLPENSEVKLSANQFVKGINEWKRSKNSSIPVEFKFLGLSVGDLPVWEPWHIYAISYYQAWMFSYDLYGENRHKELVALKGQKWADLFHGPELSQDKDLQNHLYGQPSTKEKLRKLSAGNLQSQSHALMAPPETLSKLNQLYNLESVKEARARPVENNEFDKIPFDLQLGASNAWIAYHPDRKLGPILCNDPHLNLMWPSSLYPIRFEMNDLKATGWMLPGQPFLVMGGVEDSKNLYAWGITLANYANSQDQVSLSSQDLLSLKSFQSKILVRDPKTYKKKMVEFQEQWTTKGPVAHEWYEHQDSKSPWAIDWVGFRGAKPPYEFFLEQNFQTQMDAPQSIAQKWTTPVVNYHWITKNKSTSKSSWGHLVTGLIFLKSNGNDRRISSGYDRVYYSNDSTDLSVTFVSSANQQIWENSTSQKLAKNWGPTLRADRILEKSEENFKTLGYSQIDDHSRLNLAFVKWARSHLNVSRLCSEGDSQFLERCQSDLSQLDAWKGRMNQSEWVPSLVSLWMSHLKWKLWMQKNVSLKDSNISSKSNRDVDAFVKWSRSGIASQLIWNMIHDPQTLDKVSKALDANVFDWVQSSYVESYSLMESALGVDRKMWLWGNLHRVAWQHPMLKVLGPNLPFVGPPMGGADDSPMRASSAWDPRYPLLFPIVHGAVQRTCFDFTKDTMSFQWTGVSGPSGNPFSKWSQTFSKDHYFKSTWFSDKTDKPAKP